MPLRVRSQEALSTGGTRGSWPTARDAIGLFWPVCESLGAREMEELATRRARVSRPPGARDQLQGRRGVSAQLMEGPTMYMCVTFSHSQTFIVISQKGDLDEALGALC